MRKREIFDWEYQAMLRQWKKEYVSQTATGVDDSAFDAYLAEAHPDLFIPGWIRVERVQA